MDGKLSMAAGMERCNWLTEDIRSTSQWTLTWRGPLRGDGPRGVGADERRMYVCFNGARSENRNKGEAEYLLGAGWVVEH